MNHANVAAIHGLEAEEGRQFLVMELVEKDRSGGGASFFSPGGQRFLMLKRDEPANQSAQAPRIVVVLNWFQELERLLAAKP